ncbi:hypothetical protein A8938_2217 [Algoriphagus zhangzhouensis]|uniref:Uncharacterized protein n=1 Tax=Algoriphagus zhangzhouensis TaxID=1073327 RepID=A0A1M7ZCM9_9BACT|nr:hypothetical protein A8938_2217 [Algoriphagus zhangzhouensis]SHO62644.1 hypothetical protein SAMN04488108_2215 [Algoriphagus zhangzhouensis]
MTCPNSGEPLEQGKAKIHVTPLNFFKVGFSFQHFLSNQCPKKINFQIAVHQMTLGAAKPMN